VIGTDPALVELVGVVKHYQALRPLRVADLRVGGGAIVSVDGIDAQGAEVLVHLITAALRPDEGHVRLFGRSTDDIADYDAWLAMLDGLGLVTERAVLLEQCSVAQNLALPLTIEIDPIRADVRPQVDALAAEVGIPGAALATVVGTADPETVQRVRLGRALALGPRLVVAEHPSASLPRPGVVPFARDLARIVTTRGVSLLAISADREFSKALGGTALTLDPRSGVLSRPGLLARLGLG
jgi:ABC-type transporter Mla maintaining outer membrane lipid asymmetry ATPase subunit MlaF